MHGLGEHCHRYDRMVRFLTGAGFRVYSFDQRGHGRTHRLPPQARTGTVLVQGHHGHIHSDARAVLDDIALLVRRADDEGVARAVPRFLLGHSLGGLFVTQYALTRDVSALAGLVLIGKQARGGGVCGCH